MTTADTCMIQEATRWIGTRETSPNCGPAVEMFQKTVDGKAEKESWCMCFVQFVLKRVEAITGIRSNIFCAEHCLTVWNKTDLELRSAAPAPGLIVIWKHGNTGSGHTGIVARVLDAESFETIEGNTGGGSAVERNGDGVYRKVRHLHPVGDMQVVGFLDPFLITR